VTKFQKLQPQPPAGVITPSGPMGYTYEGGIGHSRDAKSELFLLAVTNMVGEHTFYESARKRDLRYVELVHTATKEDPAWVAAFAVWLRTAANMRSASLVMAAEYVKAGGPHGRSVVRGVLVRPDEPGEMLAYWHAVHGRHVPKPVKRGVADAVSRMYTQWASLKYDGLSLQFRMGDVIELSHAKPRDAEQSLLFKYLISKRQHGTDAQIPQDLRTVVLDRELQSLPTELRRANLDAAVNECGWSWERVAGWLPGGMDAQAWEALIPKMGYMALIRNLRNFEEAHISPATVADVNTRLTDPVLISRARQLPFRFISAHRATQSFLFSAALEHALDLSLTNVPDGPGGSTLVLLDVSGSMDDPISMRSTVKRADVAGVLAVSLARRWGARVVAYNTQAHMLNHGLLVDPHMSVLRMTDELKRLVGGGTHTWQTLAATYQGEDRVVIITDEQAHPAYAHGVPNVKRLYTWNVAGYKMGHGEPRPGWYTFGGFSDACFTLVPLLERSEGAWPWEVAQVAGPLQEDDD